MWTERVSGQQRQRGDHDFRQPFERDKTRVIHSAAFRRLQQKTQIYGGYAGHFHRTRMTHSLEVASIGTSLLRHLRHVLHDKAQLAALPMDDLIDVICLLHDMGHPPFGHGGEGALNALMADFGGFESNAQTLHLITHLEMAYEPHGLDLTRRTLLGILKYPISRSKLASPINNMLTLEDRALWKPQKSYYAHDQSLVEWILAPLSDADQVLFQSMEDGKAQYHSLDCSLMDIADDIAYGVHDLEDAIHLRLISRHHFEQSQFRDLLSNIPELDVDLVMQGLFSGLPSLKKQTIGALVHYFISSVELIHFDQFEHPLLKFQAQLKKPAQALLQFLIREVYRYVIDSQPARAQEFGGQNVLIDLFKAIRANPNRLLDRESRRRLLQSDHGMERVICDAIANLTDDSAIRLHRKLYAHDFSAQWDTSFLD